MRLRFSSISRNDNPQVSFEDVKSAAGQLGFKGKDGLVVEPRTTVRGEDQCEDLGGNGEPRNTVGDVMIREEVFLRGSQRLVICVKCGPNVY